MDNYISKAKPTVIKFNSRASVNIRDAWYTFEYRRRKTN